jgi:REP element-mobilizing transposase RayT
MEDSSHHLVIYTAGRQPLLEGKVLSFVTHGLKALPRRFPGLRIPKHSVHPDRVEMVLDLHRLDEDLVRIVQTFKSEVRNLAKKDGFTQHSLWQWTYEEK